VLRVLTRRRAAGALGVAAAGLWLLNTSMLAPALPGAPRWIAHRGVHQTFPVDGVDNDTCTAARIRPVEHAHLENTIPSMEAAFAAGASMVEIDLHATSDGRFAVFHDHGLECRTNGVGAPEGHPMDTLRRLDVGYSYTADGGATYPLRGGPGVGAMPELGDVFDRFPEGGFVLHVKRGNVEDGERLVARLVALSPERRRRIWVYGGPDALEVLRRDLPDVRTFDVGQVKTCLKHYLATGWLGVVPTSCRDTVVLVPISHAGWVWGWPRRFEARLRSVGSEVVLAGPYTRGQPSTGVDEAADVAGVPADFGGYLWTNRIERWGPR
jgi:glycerophosphoryl diester phosphodiesterase